MENFARIAKVANDNGFDVVESQTVAEIDGYAHIMKHRATSARLIFLENEDNNKSFSIAFKTPPKDSTGVFHILEHSVLCGSKRYPVKEPFVNLLKSSMQTFLNAMTFPDKTVYPVASTSEQDLENLMNVYLDAVYFPQIYNKREIFEQEGWHREVTADGKLDYSGVVYNEMKGALSDPDSVLMDALCARLYPGNAYAEESGGLPAKIPTLTYEEFLDEHARHYNPKNSYITLYGNLDLDRFLKIIDSQYLVKLETLESGEINPLHKSNPVLPEIEQVEMATSRQSASAAIAFKMGEITDIVKCEMINILFDALMSSNVSPLKKKLLESDLADEYFFNMYEPVLEPALVVGMQGMKEEGSIPKFEKVLREALSDFADNNLDHELIEASINHFELVMREHNFGVADGVTYSLDLLSTWLYDDSKPLLGLQYEQVFTQLRNELESGGFERALQELLDSDQVARVEIVAVDDDMNEQPAGYGRELDNSEIEEINSAVAELNRIQEKPDDEESLSKLPYLSRKDIGESYVRDNYTIQKINDVQCITHTGLQTHGLNYYNIYFDLSSIDEELIPYLSLFSMFLGKFDTDDYTAEQINLESKKWAGSGSFTTFVAADLTKKTNSLMLKCATSCKEGNDERVLDLVSSIIRVSDFSDELKIAQLLAQAKLGIEQSLINAGHSFALRRCESNFSTAAKLTELLSGITYYQFLNEMCSDIETNVSKVRGNLEFLKSLLRSKSLVTMSHTCDENTASTMIGMLDLNNDGAQKANIQMKTESVKREAFAVKSDVTYTALRNHMKNIGGEELYTGAWPVVSKILSYDYLWNTIRVQGGAYGCGFNVKRSGRCGFYTYRDPNVASSIERFMNAGKWISNFKPTEKEFEGFVVSSVAAFDEPKKAPMRVTRGDCQYFIGLKEEDREEMREQVLSMDLKTVREQASVVSEIAESGAICTIGNKPIIEESSEFDVIVDL